MKYILLGLLLPIVFHEAWATITVQSRSVWGATTAYHLTQFYRKQQGFTICPQKPDYYCNGLMVTAFENGSSPYWMHPNDDERLSFTYIRKDIPTTIFDNAGIILLPQIFIDMDISKGYVEKPFNLGIRCAYPKDAVTTLRSNRGCGGFDGFAETNECQSLGVTTSEQWVSNYPKDPDAGRYQSDFCGFALEGYSDSERRLYFLANIEVQKYLSINYPGMGSPWNEIVFNDWGENKPERIPLMAFFYVANGNLHSLTEGIKQQKTFPTGGEAKRIAQKQQSAYYQATGIFVPLISISGNTELISFSYLDSDQADNIPKAVNVLPE